MWIWVAGLVAGFILSLVALSMWLTRRFDRALALGEAQWRQTVESLDEPLVTDWSEQFTQTTRDRMDLPFDMEDWRTASELLEGIFTNPPRRHELLKTFHQPELGYAGVVAAGAYLGELLVRHAGARWDFSEDDQPPRLVGLPDIDEGHPAESHALGRPFEMLHDLFWDRGPVDLSVLIRRTIEAAGDVRQSPAVSETSP